MHMKMCKCTLVIVHTHTHTSIHILEFNEQLVRHSRVKDFEECGYMIAGAMFK